MHLSFPSPLSFLGGWNNNPTAGQFQAVFRRLMVRCGVLETESSESNIIAQDETETLAVMAMSGEEHPSPFINFVSVMSDHDYLSNNFGGLVDNALVYIYQVSWSEKF